MKKREANEKVLRAISIGLAAFIASSTPMTVLAESDDNQNQEKGDMVPDSADQGTDNEEDQLSAQEENQQETTSPVYPTGTNESHMAEHISNKGEEFNNVETSGAESVEAMQNTADTAEEAAGEAEAKADIVQDNVDKLLGTEENQGLIDQINQEAENAENAISEAEKAADEAEAIVSEAESALENLENSQTEYNDAIQDAQDKVDADIQDNTADIVNQAQEAAQQAEDAKTQALGNLETALNVAKDNELGTELTEEQKEDILSAVQEVQDAAQKAEEAVTSAQEAVTAAENEHQAAIDEYDKMAMTFGLPLYKDLERDENGKLKFDDSGNPIGTITYTKDDIAGLVDEEEYAKIQSLQNAHDTNINNMNQAVVESKIQAVQDTEQTVTDAQDAYNTAADNYNETLESADKVLQAAKDASIDAEELSKEAEKAADETLNYYVNKAQDETDAAKQAVEEKEQEIASAQAAQADKQSAYERIKEQAIADAESQYTSDVEDAKYAYDYAESVVGEKKWDYERAKYAYETAESNYNEYKKNNWWKVWGWTGSEEYKAYIAAKKAYEDVDKSLKESQNAMDKALKEYDALNTQSAKDEYVNKAIENSKGTEEYKSLVEAQNEVNKLTDEKNVLTANYTVKSEELASRQKEVEEIQATYLKELEDTQADLRNALIQQVNDSIIDKSNVINQVEFDRALYAWAQDYTQYLCEHGEAHTIGDITYWFDSYGDDDAKVIREQINNKYPVSGQNWWNSLWTNIKDYVDDTKVLEGIVSGSNHDEVMENWIQVYKESLQGLEEKKAIMESKLSALNAEAAAEEAKAAVKEVTNEDGSLKVEALTTKTDAEGKDIFETASARVEEAENTLAEIKENAKNYTSLNKVNLTKLLNQIASAENAVQMANDALDQAKKDKDAAVRYATYAANYAEYAKEQEQNPSLQKATGFAQIAKDEQGNIIYNTGNINGFDEEDGKVVSRPQTYFTAISGYKSITVPESVYRLYLAAIVEHEKDNQTGVVDKAGAGIAMQTTDNEKGSLPLLYWELDENNNLTGNYFTSTTQLKDGGKYFIAYTFKKESDMKAKGYHFDGYMYVYEVQSEDKPETPPTQPEETPETPPTQPEETPETPPTQPEETPDTPSAPQDDQNPTVARIAVINDTVPTDTMIIEEPVPLADGIDESGIIIEDEDVPLSDSVPKTGDTSIPTAPFAATGMLAIIAGFFLNLFKKDRR